uniref:NADH-ubiquinone oxidoreductase chain 6 n=1 Tax=Gerres filamentosus TaxID=274467 RepID=A0A343WSL3_9TELE|nr:NADH dehydrogenase subunit 6 [Gerres filamentosus]AWD78023.1 NADH dehydrogenase subunit 6 [Gerres filamentosus]
MSLITFVFLMGAMLGLIAVAANPSPYFAAFGLVGAAGMGCGVLIFFGGSFLSLILFLIYLGGMLVVFAYSAALAAEPYPESWGSLPVTLFALGYCMVVGMLMGYLCAGWYEGAWTPLEESADFHVLRGDIGGVGMIYGLGGGMLLVGAWVLLLTLFVVLELTRGLSRGTLRAV